MTFVALRDYRGYVLDGIREEPQSVHLLDEEFHCVSNNLLRGTQESFLELGVKHLACVDGDKRDDVRVDLRDDKRVYVEEL